MSQSLKPYTSAVQRVLEKALCIQAFPSQVQGILLLIDKCQKDSHSPLNLGRASRWTGAWACHAAPHEQGHLAWHAQVVERYDGPEVETRGSLELLLPPLLITRQAGAGAGGGAGGGPQVTSLTPNHPLHPKNLQGQPAHAAGEQTRDTAAVQDTSGAGAVAAKAVAAAAAGGGLGQERCLVEPSVNSVRVSVRLRVVGPCSLWDGGSGVVGCHGH